MADKKDIASSGMTAVGFLWRFVAALVLVLLTYNPSHQSAYHWITSAISMLESHSVSAITWISLVCLAAVLAVGVSWSHLWRRMTGQFNVEDVDD